MFFVMFRNAKIYKFFNKIELKLYELFFPILVLKKVFYWKKVFISKIKGFFKKYMVTLAVINSVERF